MASPASWYVGEKGQPETRSGRMKNVGSRIVGVGEGAREELMGESRGDEGDRVGELWGDDMLASVRLGELGDSNGYGISQMSALAGYCKL
jgi:hypothetical protein